MQMNRIIEKLKKGEVVSVVTLGAFPCAPLVEMVGRISFDCVWFDMEHRVFGLVELSQMTLACRATGMEAMVRIVKGNYTSVMKPFEAGATGLMIPHCMSAKEARQIVIWAKYPPRGQRGFDNAGPDGDYLMAGPEEYIQRANEETFLVAQIEDRQAIESIEEIVAVDGIDIVFVGPADLSLSYGVFPDFGHEKIQKAIRRVAEAAKKQGKWWGGPFRTEKEGRLLIEKGARFVAGRSDIRMVLEGFRAQRRLFDCLQNECRPDV